MSATAHEDTFVRDNLPPKKLWPEFAFDLPELEYPARLNCAEELLDRQVAAGLGERPAIHAEVNGERFSCTYRQLLTRANQIAHVLQKDLGLVPGARVLLRGPNNPMMAACWFAVVKAGCIAVSTMPLLRARELVQIAGKARVGAALCDLRLKDELELARAQCPDLEQVLYFNEPRRGGLEDLLEFHPESFENVLTSLEDPCIIAFTSGTTGVPKGAVHFHRDVMAMCDCWPRSCLAPSPDDVFCGTPPIAFTFGLGGMLCMPMRYGAASALVERLTPELLLRTVQDYRASIVFTAPTYYRQMGALLRDRGAGFDLSSLRKCVSAGEALPDSTRQLFKQATGIEIIDGLGSTEMIHMFVSHTPERVRRGATGCAVPGYRVTVLDDAGRPCAPDTIGRLAVRGPTGCRYLADERQTQYVQNGWNITGDAYKMDADGYFYYQARTDDMIISAGYNVSGPEVEFALLEHEAVAECGVVGVRDEERGQLIKAFVVLKAGYPDDAAMAKRLQEFVRSTIAPYKYPRAVKFVSSLPRTETGKLQRFKLRQEG